MSPSAPGELVAMKSIYVLGTGLSHDGSACLLKDGKICFAIEKERITRIKHDGGNDAAAVRYLLDAAGIGMGDIALVVQNANFSMLEQENGWYLGPRLIEAGVPVTSISHHLAHAYGAFGTSAFENAAVLVIDGCGNAFDECIDRDGAIIPEIPQGELARLCHEKDSYYAFGAQDCKAVFKDFSPWGTGIRGYPMLPPTTRHSIGGVYGAASKYVFRGMEDPGKLMGLAPYGRPGAFAHEVFDLRDGRVFVNYEWMKEFRTPAHTPRDFHERFQHFADLALGIQREVERAILYVARSRHDSHPSQNLCYAGGVALNAVANRRLLTEGPFRNVHIQPAAGDNGIAIGCAYYGWMKVLGKERALPSGGGLSWQDIFTGRSGRRAGKICRPG
jgi:carbamoyltransferase